MLVESLEELRAEAFEEVSKLEDCTNFREFEERYDERIFYADGGVDACIEAIKAEEHCLPLECYMFDGWFVVVNPR